MQKARRHPEGLRPLVSARFQLSFTPLVAVVFIVQSPYWFTIGHQGVFSLGGWTPHIQPRFPEPEFTLGLPNRQLQAFHLLRGGIQSASLAFMVSPLSLAATHGIAVAFFSCAY